MTSLAKTFAHAHSKMATFQRLHKIGPEVQCWGLGLAAMLHLVCVLVLLSPACCKGDAQLAQDNVTVNLTLDVRKKMLSWHSKENVTDQECHLVTPVDSPTKTNARLCTDGSFCCRFPNSVLHSGAQLTVRGQVHGGDKFENTLIFNNSGMPGSGAVNFSCLIYGITFMNCTWVPGPAAPADVIYHLYSWFNRDDDEVECPQYLLDLRGTRVGCHFDQLGEPNRWDNYFFFINGTSQESLIPFVDFVPFVAVQNEKYNAPANVTVHNRGPETVIAWDNPHRRFDLAPATFCYELDLQRKGSSQKQDPIFQRGQDRNEYRVPRSQGDTESTVRIRVRHLRGHLWSDWSQTLSFGVPKDSHGHLAVTLGLVVGTVAMCTGVLLLLCKRCALRRKLFPNIPQVKGDFSTIFISNQEVTWAHTCPPAEPREAEDILTVQDTS